MDLDQLRIRLPSQRGCVQALCNGMVVTWHYSQLATDTAIALANLRQWGVVAGMRIGIYAQNSYEWLVFDLAILEMKAILVPFTQDFAKTLNEDLLRDHKISLLLVSKETSYLFPTRPIHVALVDEVNKKVQARAFQTDQLNRADVLSLVFSSGSAGGIKGIIISRKGVEACVAPIMEALELSAHDKFLIFLPMSNFQQRLLCYAALWNDIDLAITDHTRLFLGLQTLAPTILVAPPVFFQMVYGQFDRFPAWKKTLWRLLGQIVGAVPDTVIRQGLARLLFKDLFQQLGKKIRLLVTGMAPIKPEIAELFHRLQIPLSETYGLVETGSLTFRDAKSRKFGSVGRPVRGVNISFREDGEVIVRRQHPLSLGYFQCSAGEEQQTFVAEHEVATGDIGAFDLKGYLYLKGRKNELLVAATGYKLHPEALEAQVNGCHGVTCSVFFQRPEEHHLVCVIVLEGPKQTQLQDKVRQFVDALDSTKKVSPYVEVIFAHEPFTIENELLRPNMKLDRKRVIARYGGKTPRAHDPKNRTEPKLPEPL